MARTTRTPRLVLRFAVYTAIGLAAAGAAILLLVRNYATSQAENAIAYHARFVAEVALGERLRPSDFTRPVKGARLRTLDALFRRQVLVDGVLRAALYSPDGLITYSSDHARVGRSTGTSAKVRAAATGTTLKSVLSTVVDNHGRQRKVLVELVPVRFGHSASVGVFAFDQDYAPVARAARSTFLPIAAVLELLLVALYVSLFPILRRVTRRLRGQVEELEHHALHDSLTELPNRDLFHDRLRQALARSNRDGSRVAVMLLDLDRFKEINDTLGHQSGDDLLRELASRLGNVVRGSDTVARLGGDEFGVVLPLDAGVDVVETVDRLRDTLEQPVSLQGLAVSVGASIGVSLAPDHGSDVETLVKYADVAMYVAKERHSRYEIYNESRDWKDASSLSLAGELRAAVDEGNLHLLYQPEVDLRSGRIASVEALVRWEHASRGVLLPEKFIPLAEQTGLIKGLTILVLDQAVGQCAAWRRAGLDVRVAVNLDMRNLLDLEFPAQVQGVLRRWAVPARSLALEITESTVMADPERVAEVATTLSRMGLSIAIDDFGSGYTSLRHLKELPVDELKIDKSFVTSVAENRDDATIVRTMIELARNLGLRVVAEGVENEHTWQLLRSLDCDLAQGFFFSEPLPAPEIPHTADALDLAEPGPGKLSVLTPIRRRDEDARSGVRKAALEPRAAQIS
jgi:diguanylate cyclase (GGDEF)-like protein